MEKKGVFIGEVENGWWVEVPAKGTRYIFADVKDALVKVEELVSAQAE